MELKNGKKMLFLWLFCAFSVQADFQQTNHTLNPLPQVDAIGAIVRLGDEVLAHITRNISTPMDESSCKPNVLTFDGFESVLSQQPYGYCSFCCPIINPADHIHLYFTNKARAGSLVRLKVVKKAGAFRSAGVNGKLPTVIFIHGFAERGTGIGANTVRDAYLSRSEHYNIIQVDWQDLSSGPWYTQAVKNARIVAAVMAKLIKFYHRTEELPISNLHLVGFSLGAQIAGFIGKFVRSVRTIPRITALDPAFPLFPLEDASQRVSKLDADFVDVIHTDGGVFGFPISLGHADFYPNGGSFVQPGCELSKLVEQQMVHLVGFCSHQRAWHFYAESVRNPAAFPATKCGIRHKDSFKNCDGRFITDGYMGFPANKSTTLGDFYLITNDRPPFSKRVKEQEKDVKTINLIL